MNFIVVNRIELSKMILFSVIVVLFWFFMPILTILPLTYICYSKRFHLSQGQRYFLLFMISLSFGLLGFTTESAGTMPIDMERYREYYFYVLPSQNFIEISPVNYGFNLVNWMFSNYISNNDQTVGLVWVTIGYFFTLMSMHLLINKYVENRADFFALFMIIVLLIIPLVQMTEVLKQTAGFSLFMYGLSRKVCGLKGGGKWVVFAILIHMTVLLIFITYFYDKGWVKKIVWPIFIFSTVFLVVNLTDILMIVSHIPFLEFVGIASRIEYYADYDLFGGSRRYYIIFVMYAIICFLYVLYSIKNKNNFKVLIILSLACLCFTFSNQLTFARMIFTWFPFQLLLLVLMLDKTIVKLYSNRMIYFFTYAFFYILSNILMIYATLNDVVYSQKFIGGGVVNLMVSTVYDFFSYKVTNV